MKGKIFPFHILVNFGKVPTVICSGNPVKTNIITRRDNMYQYNCFMCNTKTLEWQYSKRNSSTIIRSWLFRSYMFCYLDLLNLYRWSSSCYAHYRIPIRFSLDLKSGRLKTQREGFKSTENGRSIINFAVL